MARSSAAQQAGATAPDGNQAARPTAMAAAPASARPICAATLFIADLAALAAATAGGALVNRLAGRVGWPHGMDAPSPISANALFIGTAAAVLLYTAAQGHYQRRVPFWSALQTLLFAATAALLFDGCMLALLQQPSRLLLPAAAWLLFAPLCLLTRKAARAALSFAGLWTIRTVMVGDPASARQTLAALASEPVLGYDVVAVLNPGQVHALQPSRRWRTLLQSYEAGLLVLCYDASSAPNRDTVESLVRERVPFAIMPQGEGLPVLGFEPTRFFSHDTVMFSFRNNLAQPLARLLKLMFDIAAVTAGLVVLAPVMLMLAALVKLDGGKVLFGHKRIGVGGHKFPCLKFRSMVIDSEAVLRKLLSTDPAAAAEWAQTYKLRDDPRITKVGRILRTTSLDELPQLFNVLRLEMSLVGPRPIVDAEVARYDENIAYYYETRPGLTGLWQVSGRTGTSYDQRVQLDTWYVKNWTLWHDIAILAKTVPAVLKRQGAY